MESEKVFRLLAKHLSSATMYCWFPLSAKYISETLKISRYKCLKYLHELREQGLVKVARYRHYDDYSEEYWLVCGWEITDTGKQTDMYKEEKDKNDKNIEEIFSSEMWGNENEQRKSERD